MQAERQLIAQRPHQPQCPGFEVQSTATFVLGDDAPHRTVLHDQGKEQQRTVGAERVEPRRNPVPCTAHRQVCDVHIGLLFQRDVEDVALVGLIEAHLAQVDVDITAKSQATGILAPRRITQAQRHPAQPEGTVERLKHHLGDVVEVRTLRQYRSGLLQPFEEYRFGIRLIHGLLLTVISGERNRRDRFILIVGRGILLLQAGQRADRRRRTLRAGKPFGQQRSREIWFLCRRYSAQQAYEWGLVNKVVTTRAEMG